MKTYTINFTGTMYFTGADEDEARDFAQQVLSDNASDYTIEIA